MPDLPALPDEITVTFPFDAGELGRATGAILDQTGFRWMPRLAVTTGVVYAGFLAWAGLAKGLNVPDRIWTTLPWVVLVAFWGFGLRAFIPWLARRTVKKQMPSMTGTQTRAFSREGFFHATPHMATNYAWSAIHRVIETDEFLLVFVAPGAALWVPKHAIPVEQEARLRELLSQVFADRPKRLLLRPWAS